MPSERSFFFSQGHMLPLSSPLDLLDNMVIYHVQRMVFSTCAYPFCIG